MTRTLLIAFLLLVVGLCAGTIQAQRIAFVNTKYILDQMPEYQSAQTELDRFSRLWQEEIDDRYVTIKRMRDAYNAEAILLTEEMKRSRMEDIEKREREARELQKKRFGVGGDLFKKRQELIQPIQDRIYQAVKDVAGTSYLAIFDIGGQSNNILFASDKYDKSDSVLRKLGIRPDKDGGSNTDGGQDREQEMNQDNDDFDNRQDGGTTAPSRGGSDQVKPR